MLRRGSEKGFSRRCPERPLGEYDPLGVRPSSTDAESTLGKADSRVGSGGPVPNKPLTHVMGTCSTYLGAPTIERGKKKTIPKILSLRPVLLRADFVLTKDRKRLYYGHFCGKLHREGSCSKAAGRP